jgi:TRAP-type transport system small permease protein
MTEGAHMERILDTLRFFDKLILNALKAVTIVSFFLLTILITANVFVRFVPVASLHWFDEIIELLFAYMVFYGAAALWITNDHFSVGDWIEKRIGNRTVRFLYKLVTQLLIMVFAVVFFYYSVMITMKAHDVTNVFAIPKKVLYSCLPISGAIMLVYTIRNIVCGIMSFLNAAEY